MPVAVVCPTCSKELVAPDELVGKLAACPQCNAQFPVTTKTGGKPTAGSVPGQPPNRSSPRSSATSDSSAAEPPVQKLITKSLAMRAALEPPTSAPAAPPASKPQQPPAAKPATKTPSVSARQPVRAPQTARFVSTDAADTRIDLGQDGQLPTLVLDESTQPDATKEETRSSNPWLLAGAIGISLVASAALLLVDTTSGPPESKSKAAARVDIETYYTRPANGFLEPYQEVLRRALQAHNREDYATEERLYRRVLNMLHAENNSKHRGLTGQVKADQPPNDEHLEDLLSRLISD